MSQASSSAVIVRAIQETVFGQVPVVGNPVELPITGESLKYNITKETSKVINTNRTVNSQTPVTANANGGLNAEVLYKAYDDMLASVMQSAWSVFGTNGVGAVVSVDVTATTITAAVAPVGANAFTNLKPGQWFSIESDNANDGKILRVHPTTAPTSTIITLDPNTVGAVTTGENIQIRSSRLTHGTTQTSWSLERENSDIGVFTLYTGMTPSKVSISMSAGSLSGMNFEFMGKGAAIDDLTMLPGTPTPPPAYEIHSGVAGATTAVWIDGAPAAGTYVKSVSLDFDNALRSQEAIGTLGAIGIGSGTIACTMTMQIYFKDKTVFERFINNQNGSYIFSSTDADGNGYIFTVPKANIADYTSNSSAKDQDQMLDLQVTALSDDGNPIAALRKLLFIDRIGAAV